MSIYNTLLQAYTYNVKHLNDALLIREQLRDMYAGTKNLPRKLKKKVRKDLITRYSINESRIQFLSFHQNQ